nr:hypothetical protein [Elusimicrobiaceae bacterium]
MKKILTMLFLLSVLCPVLSAELFANDVVLDKKVMAEISDQIQSDAKLTSKNISVTNPIPVNKKYETATKVFSPGDDDWAEGLEGERNEPTEEWFKPFTKTTDSYNIVSVYVKVNSSIKEQLYYSGDLDNFQIYFSTLFDYIIIKEKQK